MESWSVENVKASKICLRIYRPRTLKAKYIHMHDAMINITCCQVFALQFVNYIDALNLLCGICLVRSVLRISITLVVLFFRCDADS